jgi:hypothetical protein
MVGVGGVVWVVCARVAVWSLSGEGLVWVELRVVGEDANGANGANDAQKRLTANNRRKS